MIDVIREIEAVQREVGTGRLGDVEARTIRLRRTYDAPIEDVWDALTNPERIGRWFLPISGDYRLGGRYQFEGNAGGEIVACERPNRVKVTWVYGEMGDAGRRRPRSRCGSTPAGDEATDAGARACRRRARTRCWDQFGPGAVGVGWEQGALGLALHLQGWLGRRPGGVAALARGRSTTRRAAARAGARRTRRPAPIRTWSRATSRRRRRSTRSTRARAAKLSRPARPTPTNSRGSATSGVPPANSRARSDRWRR